MSMYNFFWSQWSEYNVWLRTNLICHVKETEVVHVNSGYKNKQELETLSCSKNKEQKLKVPVNKESSHSRFWKRKSTGIRAEKKKDPEKHKTDECNVRKAKNVVAVWGESVSGGESEGIWAGECVALA